MKKYFLVGVLLLAVLLAGCTKKEAQTTTPPTVQLNVAAAASLTLFRSDRFVYCRRSQTDGCTGPGKSHRSRQPPKFAG